MDKFESLQNSNEIGLSSLKFRRNDTQYMHKTESWSNKVARKFQYKKNICNKVDDDGRPKITWYWFLFLILFFSLLSVEIYLPEKFFSMFFFYVQKFSFFSCYYYLVINTISLSFLILMSILNRMHKNVLTKLQNRYIMLQFISRK